MHVMLHEVLTGIRLLFAAWSRMAPLYVLFTAYLLYLARTRRIGPKTLAWPAAISFAIFANVVVCATDELSSRVVSKAFLFVLYGIGKVRHEHLRIVWAARREIIISNGDRFGFGVAQAVNGIGLLLWAALAAMGILRGSLLS